MEGIMVFDQAAGFIKSYIEDLDKAIGTHMPGCGLSFKQRAWLTFCITGVLITNSVCWAKFERAGLGKYSLAALSWIFRNSKIPWDSLLTMSTIVIIRKYGIKYGSLGIDDTEKKRSKSTKKISKVHKIKDKESGGYIMGQCLVFLVLITTKITIPVGFAFFMPDPALQAWNKQDEKLRKAGVPKSRRPPKPPRDEKYPKIPDIALQLLCQFKINHPDLRVRCIFADALYGTQIFLDSASGLFGGIQVISQIRYNQNIRYRGKEMHVEKYFSKYPGTEQTIKIRGGKETRVIVGSARLHLCSHGKKRFILALKYEGEDKYRYIVASDLSWRTLDIAEAYTLRWLVEVFFEDRKQNEGWGALTKQTGEDGSDRSLILSLLTDHCLFFHPDQLACIENKLPAWTVGSLVGKIRVECLLSFIKGIISDENPEKKLNLLVKVIADNVIKLNPSSKHMVNKDLGRLEPTPSLKYRNAA
jgi:hypothetical protein